MYVTFLRLYKTYRFNIICVSGRKNVSFKKSCFRGSISGVFTESSQLSSFLVVGVVWEIVQVVFDSHEQTGETPAAPQFGGEDNAWDQAVRDRVG